MAIEKSGFTDPRDGRAYRCVKIGEQVWMAENLDYAGSGGVYYGNDPANGEKYGRLYTQQEAMAAAPAGWHLPTDAEWAALALYAGGTGAYGENGTAGTALKSASGWNNGGNGLDTFGFAALPGGYGNAAGYFYDAGFGGSWWSSSEYYASYVFYRFMYYYGEHVSRANSGNANRFSVRLIKDDAPPSRGCEHGCPVCYPEQEDE